MSAAFLKPRECQNSQQSYLSYINLLEIHIKQIEFKSNMMNRIKKYFQTLPGEVEDPFQRTFREF